jgi:hypothetical protein
MEQPRRIEISGNASRSCSFGVARRAQMRNVSTEQQGHCICIDVHCCNARQTPPLYGKCGASPGYEFIGTVSWMGFYGEKTSIGTKTSACIYVIVFDIESNAKTRG